MDPSTPVTWITYVRLSGEEGRRWADAYAPREPIAALCQRAVEVLRVRGIAEGAALLERARQGLEALPADEDPSVRAVLERWYQGALGYYFYATAAYDQADACMDRAYGAVVDAIGRRRWLLPLAMECSEFHMHRARVDRKRCRWATMRDHAETAVQMRAGDRPLCTLSDGTDVRLADVQHFYRSLPGMTDAERRGASAVLDDRALRLGTEREARYVMRIHEIAIQYP